MRGLRVVLMILAVLTLSASVAALSVPFQMSPLISLSTKSACDPVNMFSSVPQMTTMIPGFPTDGSFFQGAIDTSRVVTSPATHNTASTSPTVSSVYGLNGFPIISSNTVISSPLTQQNKGKFGTGFGNDPPQQTPIPPPDITVPQDKKDEALKIAANSPLCKKYNVYPNEKWFARWDTDPSDGHTINVATDVPDGSIEITVDLNTGSITNQIVAPPY